MSSDVIALRKETLPAALLDVAPMLGPEVGTRAKLVIDAVDRIVQGKREVISQLLAGVLARGHLLIEDVPGVGKTTLAQALARALGLSFSRIQVTSDLLPSDVLGVTVFDQKESKFHFRRGPIFANVVLADEVNRTTPRTQSALLEAMSEAQVSLDGTTHRLPQPFVVLATQNPREHAGTYPLPESQLDRFLMRVSVGYPARDIERGILLGGGGAQKLDAMQSISTPTEVLAMQAAVPLVTVDDSIADYAMRLVEATRTSSLISLGISTRGAIALVRAAQGHALLEGRSYLLPDDVKRMAIPCLAHRIVPAGRQAEEMDRREAVRIISDMLDRIAVPED